MTGQDESSEPIDRPASMQEAREEWFANVYLTSALNKISLSQPHDANTFPSQPRRKARPIPIVMSNGTVRSSVLRFFRLDARGNVELTTERGRVLGVMTANHLRLIMQTDAKVRVGKNPIPPIGYEAVAARYNAEPDVESEFCTYDRGDWYVPAKIAPSFLELAIPPDNLLREVELRQKIIELESEIVTLKTQARKHAEDAQRQQNAKNLRLARKQVGLPASSFNDDRGFGRGRGRARGRGGGGGSHSFHDCNTQSWHNRMDSPAPSRRRSPSPGHSLSRAHRSRPYSPPPRSTHRHQRSPSRSIMRAMSPHFMDIDDEDGLEEIGMEEEDGDDGNDELAPVHASALMTDTVDEGTLLATATPGDAAEATADAATEAAVPTTTPEGLVSATGDAAPEPPKV
ncbi:hypothetical protein D9615_005451 [Tricholomella constricta]|uniref:Uncharacterized protein n=1 Tax=Tricholomella constricta TaxID=117010 RepID=A0A8H5HEK3_9AGAR|nr:hypothetical protein D9615_005451 [Tricholomella constricta]